MPPVRRSTTMRWDANTHELIRQAAEACGVTQTQFVRDAAIIRAVIVTTQGRSNMPADLDLITRLSDEVIRRSRGE